MGPSGSGKSTLLHILGTLDRPTSGTVRLDGKDPSPGQARAGRLSQPHIGFVFQDHYLLPQCSVLENVLIPRWLKQEPATERGPGRGTCSARWFVRPARPPAGGAVRRRTATVAMARADPAPGSAAGRRTDRQPRPPYGSGRSENCCWSCTGRSKPCPDRRHAQQRARRDCSRQNGRWSTGS